jgi:hypothetical protein
VYSTVGVLSRMTTRDVVYTMVQMRMRMDARYDFNMAQRPLAYGSFGGPMNVRYNISIKSLYPTPILMRIQLCYYEPLSDDLRFNTNSNVANV